MGNEELRNLIAEPREALDIEIKEWLDLAGNDHKAKLAKEIIALANHGGGRIIIGLSETSNGAFISAGQSPYPIASFSQDAIQSIIAKYIDPPFQCHVSLVEHGDHQYPIIQIPGGHRVPVRAKAGSPDQKDLVAGRTYVRRPGPNSEEPRTNEDWDALFGKCLQNRKGELLDSLRAVLEGVPKAQPQPTPQDELSKLVGIDRARWLSRVKSVPEGQTPWLPKGYFDLAFQLEPTTSPMSLPDLRDLIRREVKNHSGWPPFVTIDRAPHSPKVVDGAIEFWFGPEKDGSVDTADHHQFWRVSPQGHFFVRSGYPEDGSRSRVAPGSVLDITSPTWRLAETLVEVHAMAIAMGGGDATVHYFGEWTGLAGRELKSISGWRMLHDGYRALQNEYRASGSVPISQLMELLPEIVHSILAPMYELFDMRLPKQLVIEEVSKLLQRSY